MAEPRIEIIDGIFAPPSGGGTFNLERIVPPRPGTGMTVKGKRILAFSCRVVTPGTTTAAVSFGTTTTGVAGIASTAEVAALVAGRKTSFSGIDLDGNGRLCVPGAAEEFLTATYTDGAVEPVIYYRLALIDEDVADDHLLVA